MRYLVCETLSWGRADAIYYITKNLRISDKIDTNDSHGRQKLQHQASSQKVVGEHLSNDPTLQHPIYDLTLLFTLFRFI